jgi:hypothetical protein
MTDIEYEQYEKEKFDKGRWQEGEKVSRWALGSKGCYQYFLMTNQEIFEYRIANTYFEKKIKEEEEPRWRESLKISRDKLWQIFGWTEAKDKQKNMENKTRAICSAKEELRLLEIEIARLLTKERLAENEDSRLLIADILAKKNELRDNLKNRIENIKKDHSSLIDINAIKEKVKMHELFEYFAIKTFPTGGNNFKCICPFHPDKNPSCTINDDKGLFFCHGCNVGGSVIDFMMKRKTITFFQAAKELKNLFL